MKRQDKYLEVLKILYDKTIFLGTFSMQNFSKENKVSTNLSKVLLNMKVLKRTKVGKRYRYDWITTYPDLIMSKNVIKYLNKDASTNRDDDVVKFLNKDESTKCDDDVIKEIISLLNKIEDKDLNYVFKRLFTWVRYKRIVKINNLKGTIQLLNERNKSFFENIK